MNKVIMMGRITHDLELKTTQSGKLICKFSIAVDRKYQKRGEEKKTDFFNVAAWDKTAEFVTKYFGKGQLILIEGELQTYKYTGNLKEPTTWYEIIAESVNFTGEKKESNDNIAMPPLPSDDDYPADFLD